MVALPYCLFPEEPERVQPAALFHEKSGLRIWNVASTGLAFVADDKVDDKVDDNSERMSSFDFE